MKGCCNEIISSIVAIPLALFDYSGRASEPGLIDRPIIGLIVLPVGIILSVAMAVQAVRLFQIGRLRVAGAIFGILAVAIFGSVVAYIITLL